MAIPLAKLVVQLEAENSKLHGALDRSTKRLDKFERGAKKVSIGLGKLFGPLAAGLSAAAFIGGTKNALALADAIDKAAKVANLTTDELQELRFAGEQLGVSNKLVDEGFRRLSRRLGEFANSGAGPAAKAMEALDISILDSAGAVRSTGDVFNELQRKIEGVEDQAQKSALAAQLFGDDAGPKLALLLAKGVDGLQKLRDEAQDIGAVLDEGLIQKAVGASDALAKLSNVIRAQITATLVELSPLISEVANKLLDMARAARAASDQAALAGLEDELSDLFDRLDRQKNQLLRSQDATDEQLADELLGLPTEDEVEAAIARTEAKITEAYKRVNIIQFGPITAPRIDVPFEFKTDQPGKTPDEIAADRLKKLLAEVKNPADALTQTFVDLNDLLQTGQIGWDTYSEAVFAAQDKIEAFGTETLPEVAKASDAARDLGITFSSAFEDAAIEGANLREVVKGLGQDILRIALRKTVTEPLAAFVTSTVSGFFAGGTNFAPGGLAVVGEQGPELVNLPRGSQVIPNNQIGGGGLTINVDARGSTDPMETERTVRRAVQESVGTIRAMKSRGALPEF